MDKWITTWECRQPVLVFRKELDQYTTASLKINAEAYDTYGFLKIEIDYPQMPDIKGFSGKVSSFSFASGGVQYNMDMGDSVKIHSLNMAVLLRELLKNDIEIRSVGHTFKVPKLGETEIRHIYDYVKKRLKKGDEDDE